MSYQALARKYRPQSFAQVKGQQHVLQTLSHAIEQDRVHHAYLFTGVRGVGKTSLARILAKSLNCLKGPSPQPCLECSVCQSITSAKSLSVVEIDAASNTGVDNIRELREQVKYLSAETQYKVYIIDEVHMLSKAAFNALLKTLEEPPPHVIFVFATTEVNKIPVTVLSRCQRFDLNRLSELEISEQLQEILEAESICLDATILPYIAHLADGSMRDALSLLDTLLSFSAQPSDLTLVLVQQALGHTGDEFLLQLIEKIAAAETQTCLEFSKKLYLEGRDLGLLTKDLLGYLHQLLLMKSSNNALDLDQRFEPHRERLAQLAASFDLEQIQIWFQITLKSFESIQLSEFEKPLFDILLIKLIHGSPFNKIQDLLEGNVKKVSQSKPKSEPRYEPKSKPSTQTSNVDWRSWFKPALLAILDNAQTVTLQKQSLTLNFSENSFWLESVLDRRDELLEVVRSHLGPEAVLNIEKSQANIEPKKELRAQVNVSQDPVVQDVIDVLNAKVEEVGKL